MAQVTFKIHYATRWGEKLFFERKSSGSNQPVSRAESVPMQYAGDGYWLGSLDSVSAGESIDYRYVFCDEQGDYRREPIFRRLIVAGASSVVYDEWLPPEYPGMAFLRQAFAGIIFNPNRGAQVGERPGGQQTLKLTLRAPRVMNGYQLCVTGNNAWLGNWEPSKAQVMSGFHYPLWEICLPLTEFASPVEFKFGLWSETEKCLVVFEEGGNRHLPGAPADAEVIEYNCAYFRHRTWWKGAGVAVPVFSLRSETGYGIGEFADLELLADWAAGCGMHLVQLLPVNDTTSDFSWKDSYPYKAISSMALHPIYINIDRLFEHYHQTLPVDYTQRRDALNRLPQVDYETVLKDKLEYLRQLFARVGATALASETFKEFWSENHPWLKPYAAFCRLRDQYATADFACWGANSVYRESNYATWFKPGSPEYGRVMFHCVVQWHLEQQLQRAVGHGHAKGVAFKGDLPIGIDRCSVEAWTEPDLFRLDFQTGAPPDIFAVLGQNWGFPTYNWQKMAADGYTWWRRRLQKMSACFDALRIDHILGFFRIWQIPAQYREGIMGHFNPSLPLSVEEIRQAGFQRDPAQFTVPAVAEADLPQFFGEQARKAVNHLLSRDPDGYFRVKTEFDTLEQRQVWYDTECVEDEAARLEDGLKRLGYEVLFVEDPDCAAHFHPRIELQSTRLFQSLAPPEREVLRRLHDDFFYRRHNRFWEESAMKKLPALMEASPMLICGEDLGMIPDAVPGVLKRLSILSLEVQRMPKSPGQNFGRPENYPYLSVCTTSTHDMPTLRGWWEDEIESRQLFFNQVMQRPGEAPTDCPTDVCEWIVRQHLSSASMWCVLPLQDWLALDAQLRRPNAADERINVPAIPRYYWRYRLHLTLEQLHESTGFNQLVTRLITESGRDPVTPEKACVN
jgi:4-alpha-glucanotransferase